MSQYNLEKASTVYTEANEASRGTFQLTSIIYWQLWDCHREQEIFGLFEEVSNLKPFWARNSQSSRRISLCSRTIPSRPAQPWQRQRGSLLACLHHARSTVWRRQVYLKAWEVAAAGGGRRRGSSCRMAAREMLLGGRRRGHTPSSWLLLQITGENETELRGTHEAARGGWCVWGGTTRRRLELLLAWPPPAGAADVSRSSLVHSRSIGCLVCRLPPDLCAYSDRGSSTLGIRSVMEMESQPVNKQQIP